MSEREQEIYNALVEDLEARIGDLIEDELERTREDREEALAEQIEQRLWDEFEDNVDEMIVAALEADTFESVGDAAERVVAGLGGDHAE
jgi:hypothetical protein